MLLNTIEPKRDAKVSLFGGSIMGLFGGIGGGAPRQLPTPETISLPGLLLQIIPPVVDCDEVGG